MTIKVQLEEKSQMIEAFLSTCLNDFTMPQTLQEAMYYSLMAGGKRIRPVLCLCSYALAGGRADMAEVLPFAVGIECIHTYSLIHDDLPAMDNDDMRRGKPSNHKQFGEATAILAGDALLTDAFVLMSSVAERGLPAQAVLRAVHCVAEAAGSQGMVGGQMLDMAYTGGAASVTLPMIRQMQAGKTGALLMASCVSGGLLAQADSKTCGYLEQFGRQLGLAFQIADDILDEVGDPVLMGKPVGSDAAAHKSTYPALVGMEESVRLANEASTLACAALQDFSGENAQFLKGLATYVVERVS